MSAPLVRATPFHARAAEANALNTWTTRGGWTLATSYGDPRAEALACRATAGIADITWRWRVMIEGARAGEFLSRLTTRDAQQLVPGTASKALWLTDKGGLRGAGIVARYGREAFLLASAAPDTEWIASAATLFDVRARDVSEEEGGLAIVGPYARKVLAAAGLDAGLEPLAFRKLFWRGLDVTLSRWGEHGGYELWCKADDALIAWDHLMRAGEVSAMHPAGLQAMDLLDLEAGIARPGRDYEPARDGRAGEPSPRDLGLDVLVDPAHTAFNGRAVYLAAAQTKSLVGIELDSQTPAPRTALFRDGQLVGRTLSSLYSPALRRAIALAEIAIVSSQIGTKLTLGSPSIAARVVALPFLPTPDSLLP